MLLVHLSVSLLRSSFEWLSDQETEWPSDQMTGWPNDWVTGWQEPWQSVEELKLELSSRKRHLKSIVLCNLNIVKHGLHVCLRLSAGLHYSLICAESALGSAGLTATLVTSARVHVWTFSSLSLSKLQPILAKYAIWVIDTLTLHCRVYLYDVMGKF